MVSRSARPSDSAADAVAFIQLLVGLLDEGRRTATYKLAVVIGLMDCCLEGTNDLGQPPERIATRDLARSVVATYWPQVRPYPVSRAEEVVLRQSTTVGKAVSVEAVRVLRKSAADAGAHSFHQAELLVPEAVDACLDIVELNLVRMPLGKLQRPGAFIKGQDDYPRFLYDDRSFHEGITRPQLKKQPMFVELAPGAGDWMVSLSGLLRPLLELHWTRAVARYNSLILVHDRLREFLFGASRIALQRVVKGLREMQDGRCFYCSAALRRLPAEVDHFIPWSRFPNDALANLVLADRRCNNSKRDHLAAIPLLVRWAKRKPAALAQLAEVAKWPLRFEESAGVARALYTHLPNGAALWAAPSELVLVDTVEVAGALDLLGRVGS